MEKRDKLIKFILKPPMWLCIAVWVIGAVSLAGSITLYFLNLGLKLWALPVHIVALLFFLLSIYAVLTVTGVPERAKDKPRIKQFFSSYDTRAFVYATGSVLFNLCYVVFGLITAVMERSVWIGALVGYHVFLIVPRFTVLYITKIRGGSASDEVKQSRAYAYCGLALIVLALALVPVIRLVLLDRNTYRYFGEGVVYVAAIAAYSFTKMGIAIYNLKKVRHSDDVSLIAVKNASFADALISIFALQAMMLKVLPDSPEHLSVMNPVLGGLAAAVIFGMGLHMLVTGFKRLKALPASSEATDDGEAIGNTNAEPDGDKN